MGVRCSLFSCRFYEIKMKYKLNMQVYQNQNEIMKKGKKIETNNERIEVNLRRNTPSLASLVYKMRKTTRPLGDYIKSSSADHWTWGLVIEPKWPSENSSQNF